MKIKKLLGAARRGLYSYADGAVYRKWLSAQNIATNRRSVSFEPLITIVVPVYDPDISFFDVMVNSVIAQTYQNWELILVDDKSPKAETRTRIKQFAKIDKRIKYLFLKENHHIAGATNEGFKVAKGSYVGLLDHDDVLLETALEEVVLALSDNKKLEFIYTDEDKIIGSRRVQPFFKPSLNVDLLHSVNYITHFAVIKKSTLDKVGYEDKKYNGAQDWELFLRIVRNVPQQNIHHIAKILYSWRVHALSTSKDMGVKPYVLKSQENAIRDDLKARGVVGYELALNRQYNGQWQLKYTYKTEPSVLYVQDISKVKAIDIKGYNFVAVTTQINQGQKKLALELIGEAARKDVAIAIASSRVGARTNIRAVLGKDNLAIMQKFTHISVSKHIYETARYNIPVIYAYDVAVVATETLKQLPEYIGKDIHELSVEFEKIGLPHVHIPAKDLL